jgi:regulator of protease activity HflC (stomatin/prohibitin superfamily)
MTLFNNDREKRTPPTIDHEWGAGLSRRSVTMMLLTIAAVVIGVWLIFSFLIGVTRIEAGYVGVEVNLAGSQRGASEIPVRTGWVFYSPLTTQIIEFPTYVQTVKWTKNVNEGNPLNEEMGFNSKEGMEIFADVSLSYAIEPSKVPDFYVKYRVNNLDRFTHGILRDIVRNSLNEVASTYTVEDVYGEKKAEFLSRVEKQIQEKVANVGVGVQQFGFIGAPRVPSVIAQAITAKAQAIQVASYTGAGGGRRQSHPAEFADSAVAGTAATGEPASFDRPLEWAIAVGGNRARQWADVAVTAFAVVVQGNEVLVPLFYEWRS